MSDPADTAELVFATPRMTRAPEPPELEEGYYVRNFERVLNTVGTRYGDLLSDDEASYIADFQRLSEPAKRLYVRLILRKGPCFQRDLLSYEEIGDLGPAARELVDAEFLDHAEDAPPEDLLAVLRRPELVELVAALGSEGAVKGLRRPELVALLMAKDAAEVRAEILDTYEIWRPLKADTLLLIRLLFFGNLGQDFSEFVISDLGIVRYESYALNRETRLFQDRMDIDQALGLRLIRREVYDLLAEGQVDDAVALATRVLLHDDPWRPLARRQVDGILIQVARQLEREKRFEEALELYHGARRPPARERLCRTLERLDRPEQALALCREMAAEPRDETESGFVPYFEHRLRKRLGLTREPWRRPKRPTAELSVKRRDMPVEHLALEALGEQGRQGIFSENWLWRGLFGLAFWDIVFAPVPGVFHHPFQMGPWDLGRPEFRVRRKNSIAERLEELGSERDLKARLWPVYEAKMGIANALVPWHEGVEQALSFALEHVRGETLAIICDRLSSHLRRYRRGLPDLLVVDPDSPVGFELLEVKGPGDQIRPEQGAWIDFLNKKGIPARVLKVSWQSRD